MAAAARRRILLLSLLAALAPVRAAEEPKVGAALILGSLQDALRSTPSGAASLKLLDLEGISLSIASSQGLETDRRFVSRWIASKSTIYFNVENLEGVYAEMEAAGMADPRKIGAEMGLKLAPSLAHEACHVRIAGELRGLTGLPVPDSVEEEALCLGEELAAFRALTLAKPWELSHTQTDLDRLEERAAWALLGEGGELRARTAEHYPGLLSFNEERGKNLSLFDSKQEPFFSPLAVNRAKFEAALDELEKKIRRGGASLLQDQEDYAKDEQLARRSQELYIDHPPRQGGNGLVLARPPAYDKVRAYFELRLATLVKELAAGGWQGWLEKQYPEWFYARATQPAEKLRWALASALKIPKTAGDLFLEGNPYYLRHARKLAGPLGRDVKTEEKEISLLEEAKIKRMLDTAESLAARNDEASRKWSLRLLRRTGVESREIWDMTPYWISSRQDNIYQNLQKALKPGP